MPNSLIKEVCVDTPLQSQERVTAASLLPPSIAAPVPVAQQLSACGGYMPLTSQATSLPRDQTLNSVQGNPKTTTPSEGTALPQQAPAYQISSQSNHIAQSNMFYPTTTNKVCIRSSVVILLLSQWFPRCVNLKFRWSHWFGQIAHNDIF